MKRLYRSRTDRVISGVCGGIAKMLGIDAVIIRVLWVILMFTFGFGVLAYIIAWAIIPAEPLELSDSQPNVSKDGRVDIFETQNQQSDQNKQVTKNMTLVIGIAILILGLTALVTSLFGVTGWLISLMSKIFWPSMLIVVGAVIIYYYSKRN